MLQVRPRQSTGTMKHLQLHVNLFGDTASNTTAGQKKEIKNAAWCEAVLEEYLLERVYPRGLPVVLGAKLVLIVFPGVPFSLN